MTTKKAIFVSSEGQVDTSDFTTRMSSSINLHGMKWNIALVKLTTYNSIWNISEELNNTVFKYNNSVTDRTLNLEPGNYSFTSLVEHIQDKMLALGDYTLSGSTPVYSVNFFMDLSDGFVSMILSDGYTVDFTGLNIRNIFGFNSQQYLLSAIGERKANVRFGVDQLLVHLNIVSGNSFFNGQSSDVIFSFGIDAQPNEIIVREPSSSLPVGVNQSGAIDEVRIYLTDQQNRRVNLRGSPFSCVFSLTPILE
jgi:hypothetical protein